MSSSAILAQGIVKRFGKIVALNGLDLEVQSGELFGLLGPNGAGKTTTINILAGLARPDQGKIIIAGIDCTRRPRSAQHLIGVVPDENNLYPELTGWENLCFCAALYGIPKQERIKRAERLLTDFGLKEAAHRRFGEYSKGMKRKLTIAAGIIHQPPILFLDEPTTGIDIQSARHIRQLIAELHRAGITVLLTTHYIEEAQRLCDRIGFIVAGRIVRTDTVTNLLAPVQGAEVLELTVDGRVNEAVALLTKGITGVRFTIIDERRIRADCVAGRKSTFEHRVPIGLVADILETEGIVLQEARRSQPTLEEVFIQTTGLEADALRREKEKK
jgi:ABC-2 type transport system ATP-binding protein